jgi:hypothetical protein
MPLPPGSQLGLSTIASLLAAGGMARQLERRQHSARRRPEHLLYRVSTKTRNDIWIQQCFLVNTVVLTPLPAGVASDWTLTLKK